MCFNCLTIREDAIGRGIPQKYTRYWACQKNVVVTEKDIRVAKDIIQRIDINRKRPEYL